MKELCEHAFEKSYTRMERDVIAVENKEKTEL